MPISELLRSVSILWSLIHVLVLFIFLYRSRYSRKVTCYATVFACVVLAVVNVGGVVLYGFARMGQLMLLTCTVPSLIFFYFMSEDRGAKFFFTFGLTDTVVYWVMIVTNLLDAYLGGGKCVIMFLTRLVAYPLMEYWVVQNLRESYRELQKAVKKGWWQAACLSACFYVLLILMSSFPTFITERPAYLPELIFVLVAMPLCYMTILTALQHQMQVINSRSIAQQKVHLESQLENQEDMRRLHHDIKAYTTTLTGLLQNGKYDEAMAVADAMNRSSQLHTEETCPDPYVNAVLSQFIPRFSRVGARLKLDIRLGDEQVPGMALSLILVNAMENVITALLSLPAEKRLASVQIRRKNRYIVLRIINTCDPALTVVQGELPETTKTEPGHGYGLETIRRIARANGGEAVCYTEKAQFILDVNLRT